MDKLIIAKRLKNIRKEQKISREKVVEDLGISYSALSAYEIGQRIPRDYIKLKLAEYYKTTVQAIFFTPDDTICNIEEEI
jgi:transcriptional regulator with XRE-family HTH domain